MLCIRLQGALRVTRTREDRPLALPPSCKTRALLAFLALEPGPHRRERLCTLFWDSTDDPRGALRWSLSKLRTLVEDTAHARLQATREQVTLVLEPGSVDVLRSRALLAVDADAIDIDDCRREVGGEDGECLQGLDLSDCADYQAWCVATRDEERRLTLSRPAVPAAAAARWCRCSRRSLRRVCLPEAVRR